jgi:hypothetical protein
MKGAEVLRSFVASSTFGASLDQTVVNINTELREEEEGRIYLTLFKNDAPIISSSTFIVKEAVWEEKKDEDNNPILFSP